MLGSALPSTIHGRKNSPISDCEGLLVVSSHTKYDTCASEGRPPSPTEGLQTVSACRVRLQGLCEGGRAEWVMQNIKKYSGNTEPQLQMALNQHQASSVVSV